MPIKTEAINGVLLKRGYSVMHETQKKRRFQKNSGISVYLNLATISGKTALILHPQTKSIAAIRRIPDLTIGGNYYHASNLTSFPKRRHKGESDIGYGWGVTLDSEVALNALLTAIE